MFGSTMMLTVGQALDRAQHEAQVIRIQVAGDWIAGRVVNTDTQSVVVRAEDGTTYVMRIDAITCVALPVENLPVEEPRVPAQQSGQPSVTEARI